MVDVNDIIGKTFNRLTVEDFAYKERINDKYPHWNYYYSCKCKCGNNKIVLRNYLLKGEVKSCGCLNREQQIQNGKKRAIFNKYDLSGEYGICYATNTNQKILFDLEDYDKIKNYGWHVDKNGYAVSSRIGKMHKLIMDNLEDHKTPIDHINHNTLDNRKENLRICTSAQNAWNKKAKGYSYRKDNKKYRAYITVNSKRIYLGDFDTKEEAVQVRENAEIKYFGGYRYEL